MQAPAPIPVFRPSYLTDGVEFQGSLTESPANVFYQSVNASIASLNRMQFQWRSVSDQLLVSPVMMLRFKIKVQCPQLWTQLTSYCSVHGLQTAKGSYVFWSRSGEEVQGDYRGDQRVPESYSGERDRDGARIKHRCH